MAVYPEEARNNFLATIGWMKDKACTRKSGLGTKLPWDNEWIVETLSDSTIYMAYYTISHIVNKYKIPPAKLTDEVLDYVFLGKGEPANLSRSSKIPGRLIKLMRTEFDYFYPYDFRNSAKDLVQNHLTFFLYQHAAVWNKKNWPAAIAVNGYVNVEGEKMSKSRGNIIPLRKLVEDYGADLVRINIATASEGIDDADWRSENIKGFRQRIEFLYDQTKKNKKMRARRNGLQEKYLASRLNSIVKEATDCYETTRFRTGINHALFEATNELKWYLARTGNNPDKKTMKNALSVIIRLSAPFVPHICEEMWSDLGNKDFVSASEFPKYNPRFTDKKAEMSETFIRQALEDVREIQKITSMKPKKIRLFVADDWKFSVYDTVMKNKSRSSTEVVKEIMATDMKKYGSATIGFIQGLYKKIGELNPVLQKQDQISVLSDSKDFLEKEIRCSIEIIDSEKSDDMKARSATPQKVGILLE